jgi:hypothetical protein
MNEDIAMYNIVTIKNVDVAPIEVIYNKTSYGVIEPGQIKRLPEFLARHATKHLINQILNRLNIPVSNMTEREKWASQIVVDHEQQIKEAPKTKEEALQAEIDRLNAEKNGTSKASPLDAILGKKRDDAPPLPEDKEPGDAVAPATGEQVSAVNGLSSAPTATPESGGVNVSVPVEEIPAPVIPEGVSPELVAAQNKADNADTSGTPADTELNPSNDPERGKVLAFLSGELAMNLQDTNTRGAIKNMTTDQLKQEFSYDDLKAS